MGKRRLILLTTARLRARLCLNGSMKTFPWYQRPGQSPGSPLQAPLRPIQRVNFGLGWGADAVGSLLATVANVVIEAIDEVSAIGSAIDAGITETLRDVGFSEGSIGGLGVLFKMAPFAGPLSAIDAVGSGAGIGEAGALANEVSQSNATQAALRLGRNEPNCR